MSENLYMNHVVPECRLTAESTKTGINANINLKKKILEQIDVYSGLFEGKRHQSLAKPDQIKF